MSLTASIPALPAVLVLAGASFVGTGARADPIEDIIGRVTLAQYQSYLRVLTGVDPVPGTPGTYLTNRWSHGPDITIAAQWIQNEFIGCGLDATTHTFDPAYGPNVIGELRGTTRPDDIYVVCAHYDTYHASNQLLAPGCDDNGSGSAAVMTAAWILSQYEFEATIRFITFAGEEQWMVGSLAYVAAARFANENIVGAINLDMILHPSFDNVQPDPDHDLDIGANGASQWLAQAVAGHLGTYTPLEYQVHNDPGFVSDQWSFWQHGYDAVGLLENTVNEIWGGSNTSYHQLSDVMTNAHFEWDFGLATVRGAIASLIGLAGLDSSTCYADCDTSTGVGTLDIFDFLCFQDGFVSGDPYACDCDTTGGPGICDILDFLCFQDAFVAGCP